MTKRAFYGYKLDCTIRFPEKTQFLAFLWCKMLSTKQMGRFWNRNILWTDGQVFLVFAPCQGFGSGTFSLKTFFMALFLHFFALFCYFLLEFEYKFWSFLWLSKMVLFGKKNTFFGNIFVLFCSFLRKFGKTLLKNNFQRKKYFGPFRHLFWLKNGRFGTIKWPCLDILFDFFLFLLKFN